MGLGIGVKIKDNKINRHEAENKEQYSHGNIVTAKVKITYAINNKMENKNEL